MTGRPEPAPGFLAVPPFPGARVTSFGPGTRSATVGPDLIDLLRAERSAGSYWGHRPDIAEGRILDRTARSGGSDGGGSAGGEAVEPWPSGTPDPWHLLERSAGLICEEADPVRAIAAVLGVPTYDRARQKRLDDPAELLEPLLAESYRCPFRGEALDCAGAIRLGGHWRRLIDSNRDIAAALGFAFWKQPTVAALLWGGDGPVPFTRKLAGAEDGKAAAIWRSRAGSQAAVEIERRGLAAVEVEDGFLRSQGLGADCVPPLSITVDRLGPHFDPRQPSELENLLQNGSFSPGLLARAAELRQRIIAAGLGKYESGGEPLERPAGERRHLLVTGQVEDDRSVMTGGCGLTSNLELLRRAREVAPDAFILYKPHPDVLAGHRRGVIGQVECLRFADLFTAEESISSLIGMVDEVHVNTSLAGFEALMRGKAVTTHGVPFYAGWGLTRDLGPVPSRRNRALTIDELVAATLLVYPRYIDPVSGLPCPAEVVVSRLTGQREADGVVVRMRRIQGKAMARLKAMFG